MIPPEKITSLLDDARRHFLGLDGLLSMTVHGSYATGGGARRYVDVDLIFLFHDDAVEAGLRRVEAYFSALVQRRATITCRILYRTQSGPMHPLREDRSLEPIVSLQDEPIIFFHISVFPRSFYSADHAVERRPSRLLLHSWQALPPLLGKSLGTFAAVKELSTDDIRHEGLGLRDCIEMIGSRTRYYWDWGIGSDGKREMIWRSAPLEDMETFEIPLYAFKWSVVNCARFLRTKLPLRDAVSDAAAFEQLILPNRLRSTYEGLQADLSQVEKLRLRYSEDPRAFWDCRSMNALYDGIASILSAADTLLEQIGACVRRDFSFDAGGSRVPVTLSTDATKDVGVTINGLNPDHCLIVVDAPLRGLYATERLDSAETIPVSTTDVTDKSMPALEALLSEAERVGVTSASVMVAVGGGNVGNTVGTAAGLVCRGTRLVQLPTSLVAQLDSTIGVKQSVNGRLGKNYIGLFHAPCSVLIQPLFLLSLPSPQILDGLVEAMKHGLCQDQHLVSAILRYVATQDDRPFDLLVSILARTIELKIEYLELDPRENDSASFLELGHKIGHAVEFVAAGAIKHGQCVAFGMLAEGAFLKGSGIMPVDVFDYLKRCVQDLIWAKEPLTSLAPTAIAEQLWHDNKRRGRTVPFSYLVAPQQPRSLRLPLESELLKSMVEAIKVAQVECTTR